MKVNSTSTKSEIMLSFVGGYTSADYYIIIQHVADTSTFDTKRIVVDMSQLSGSVFKICNLCLVLGHHLRAFNTHFILPATVVESKKWFEPVWSTVINKGEKA